MEIINGTTNNFSNVGSFQPMAVTSIEELKRISCGELVELPPFSEGTHFIARLKRPSMLAMTKAGKIPNELLVEANTLFTKGTAAVANENNMNEDMMKDLFTLFDVICEESFVEPTYKQLVDNGIELTDEQRIFVFSYSLRGVESLKSFRQ